MNHENQGFHISHVYTLWQDLSHHNIIFDLVTLTLKFDLLFKNFNLGHNLWIMRDRALIFHMSLKGQDLSHHTIIFYLVTLTLKFDLLFKNFNLGHNLWNVRERAFIFHMSILRDKTFYIITKFLTKWPWLCCHSYLVASRQTSLSFWQLLLV